MLDSYQSLIYEIQRLNQDLNNLTPRDWHDIYWRCVSELILCSYQQIDLSTELVVTRSKVTIQLPTSIWKELYVDLGQAAKKDQETFLSIISNHYSDDRGQIDDLTYVHEESIYIKSLLILTLHLDIMGRFYKPRHFSLTKRALYELNLFNNEIDEIYETIKTWIVGTEGSLKSNALKSLYYCYWRPLRRILMNDKPQQKFSTVSNIEVSTENQLEEPSPQPIDLLLGRQVVMHRTSSPESELNDTYIDQEATSSKVNSETVENTENQDRSKKLIWPKNSVKVQNTKNEHSQEFTSHNLMAELNRLRSYNDQLSSVKLDHVIQVMLAPILSHQGMLNNWLHNDELSQLDLILVKEIKNTLIRGQLKFVGEIGEVISVDLPNKRYQMEQISLPRHSRTNQRFRVTKRGIEMNGHIICPISILPLDK